MGRGPGLLSEIGFQVTAVSDGEDPEGQQAVKILRIGTEVSSTEISSTLGTFNQGTLVPPPASSDGNIVLVDGTDTPTPVIGGADPVGTGGFQKRHKVVPLTTNSNQGTVDGYMTSASVGSAAGDIAHAIATNEGAPLLAHRYVYINDVTGSTAGEFIDNGTPVTIGTAPGATGDIDIIGWGTWNEQSSAAWLKFEGRQLGDDTWYDKTGAPIAAGSNPSFSEAARILISTSQDTMMTSTYALNNSNPVTYNPGASYPNLDEGGGVFSSQAYAANGAQISFAAQTIGTGNGNGYLNTGDLYDFGSGGTTANEFTRPTFDWSATGEGDKVTGDQDFKYDSERVFAGYGFSSNMTVSGANNFVAGSSLPAAQGSVLYYVNGNEDKDWGFMGIIYSIGAEIETITTDQSDATFTYSSVVTTGTFSVSTVTDNTTKCEDLQEVTEGTGSVKLNLCAGEETNFDITASFAF